MVVTAAKASLEAAKNTLSEVEAHSPSNALLLSAQNAHEAAKITLAAAIAAEASSAKSYEVLIKVNQALEDYQKM